ncbi:hypothetical protein [Herbaspirillum huttiense]|uniref:hypothetical protein n=1 Tax=Herbaspirillum huttiense TaxID=863372 RepID=UPI002176A899|nr:hypothetical protein [Herbaspirillum huttiense]UWE19331.1 hypothetical protein NY669_27015 [Herbaspirillum huttiense]
MTEKPGSVIDQGDPLIAMDFVYRGRRILGSGKLAVCLAPLQDGKALQERHFLFDKKAHRAIGGIYSGAKFTANEMSGLSAHLTFVGKWQAAADLIDWEARDALAEQIARSKRLESDVKKVSEIEKILLPLRRQFENYRQKRDTAGMEALRKAVVSALGTSPRAFENE